MDPFTIVLGGGIGAAVGALTIYLIMSRRGESKHQNEPKLLGTDFKRRINRSEMEKARRDLNTVLLEKDLISGALTRVYEAEADGKISHTEREELAARYKKRLGEVEEKLGDTEITIEVGELERLRDELMNLFEKKMHQIDNRLQDAGVKLNKLKGQIEPIKTLEDIEKKPRVKTRTPKIEEIEVDDKVKALREEVLESLARLEQMDIEV
jgi:gas vesicle protein|tara:strand:- start:590 stop:1219 length:630 start_codon:yes stop_codon:yes gene_type:complete